jgi:bifunctional non-homologous end joining protein LigD
MAEQLSLRFEPALPAPGAIAPMLATPRPDAFDSDAFLFEPWWGGHRALAFVGPGDVPGAGGTRIVDAAGIDRSAAVPELAGLAVRVAARSAVLDGELVVVDSRGRIDPGGLRERIEGRPGRPVAYLVFDLLHLDGTWLLGRPLERRRELLRRILRPGDEVVVVPSIAGEGRALHAAVVAQGIAGILARRRTSPYLPGVRSMLWRSIAAVPAPGADVVPADAGPLDDTGAPTSTAPVLALFRRLPLDEPVDGPPDDAP